MKKGRILLMLFVLVISAVSMPLKVSATVQEEASIQPRLSYIFIAENSLLISELGEASISTSMVCLDFVTKCEIKVVLQRKENGVFANYKTWNHSENGAVTIFDATHYLPRATYRAVTTFTAYVGTKSESVTITGRDVVHGQKMDSYRNTELNLSNR